MSGGHLSEGLLAAASPPQRAALSKVAGLEAILEEIVRAGREAWASFPVEEGRLLSQLGRNLPAPEAVETALRMTCAADLHLAAACAAGNEGAWAAFEREVMAPVRAWLLRQRSVETDAADDVLQRLRERLLVGDEDRRPRIGDYAGRGPLQAWVRAIAVRLALDARREEQRRRGAPEGEPESGGRWFPHDPELSFIKAQHQADFRKAFGEALATLDARDRALLKLHYQDGLSVDSLGMVFRTSRSTAARWVVQARERLLVSTKEILRQRLRLQDSELDSFLVFIRSELEVSLTRLAE